MSLTVVVRKQTSALTISGSVKLKDGSSIRVQRRAASDTLALAREEAAVRTADILRTDWHGPQDSVVHHTFDEAIVKYLEAKPRRPMTAVRIERLRTAIGGEKRLPEINQDTISELRKGLWQGCTEATILREAITPLRAVLRIAAKRKWCDFPEFETPELTEGRTHFSLPSEAEEFILAAQPHLKPLAIFLYGTGTRLAEAIYLDWRDVDLVDGYAIVWDDRTKAKKRRNVELPPRVIAALTDLPHREGMVFRRPDGKPYVDRHGMYGGQIKRAWNTARQRAGLRSELTPHSTRHSWASWHYALHRDMMRLKFEGGWASLTQVERYAHLMKGGHEQAIRNFLGLSDDRVNPNIEAGVIGYSRTAL